MSEHEPASAGGAPAHADAQGADARGAGAQDADARGAGAQDAAVLHTVVLHTAVLHTGAIFGSASAALAFWAAVAGAGLARDVRARRGPDGRCWVEVHALPARAAALAVAAGGLPFAGHDRVWHATGPSGATGATGATPRDPALAPAHAAEPTGRVLITAAHREELLDADWPIIDVRHLLGASALRPAPLRAQPEIAVFVPAALARWVLDRSLARSIDTRLAPARWRPLHDGAPGRGGVWMHMRGADEPIPAAWLRALVDLPGAIVARAPHDADPRLCVDVRYRAPVPEPLLARLLPPPGGPGGPDGPDGPDGLDADVSPGSPGTPDIPGIPDSAPDDIWLLAGPDIGPGRVALLGDWVPGSALLVAPAVPVAPAPSPGEARLPAPAPVQIVRASGHAGHGPPDAVLVDAQELDWLRAFLMARPLGERVYVVPGAERTLVLVAAETAAGLPLGVPLRRVGPGALYLEHGLAFAPPLPEAARAATFGVNDDEAVTITREGAWRFRVRTMVPAWTMWAGAGPRMRAADGEHAGNLRALADAFAREAARARRTADPRAVSRFKLLSDSRPAAGAPVSAPERARLRDEAAADVLRGELASAAGKLERAGDPAAAARLYERAARQRAARREEPA
jgi:FtsH ternary system domain X7